MGKTHEIMFYTGGRSATIGKFPIEGAHSGFSRKRYRISRRGERL